MMEPRERSLGWCVAPTYDLTDRVFRLIVQIVETHLSHRIRTLSERDQRILMTNFGGGASEVRGKSADRPASLLGEALDWLVVDEAVQLEREVWESHLSQRLLDRHGWALLMSTPKGPGWFFRMYRRGQRARDSTYESWSSPSITNPHLDAAAIEAERTRLPEPIFRQEYEGLFVGVQNEPCELCLGPSASPPMTVILQEGEVLPTCIQCDRPTDADGRTVVGTGLDGEPRLLVIVETGMDETPEPLPDAPDSPIPVLNATQAGRP